MVEKLFELWNATDDISAAPDLFATEAEAEQYAKEFRAGYALQGFYKTSDGWKIDPADVELVIRQVEVEVEGS